MAKYDSHSVMRGLKQLAEQCGIEETVQYVTGGYFDADGNGIKPERCDELAEILSARYGITCGKPSWGDVVSPLTKGNNALRSLDQTPFVAAEGEKNLFDNDFANGDEIDAKKVYQHYNHTKRPH